MKAVKKLVQKSALLLLFFLSHIIAAQEAINGELSEWEGGEAKIVSLDIFSGDMIEIGKISADGNVEIPLSKDFLSEVRKKMEKAQEEADEFTTISLKNLQKTYSCDAEEPFYSNGEAVLTGFPKQMFVARNGDLFGALMLVSDPAIVEYHASFGRKSSATGKFLEWVYFEDEAAVTGECYSNRYANNETFRENQYFNLEFKPGWNLVQHEILETYEDQDGKIYPKEIQLQTIKEIPEDVEWTFVHGRKIGG